MKTTQTLLALTVMGGLSSFAGVGYYTKAGNANKAWTSADLWEGTVPQTADDLAVFANYTNSFDAPFLSYTYNDLLFADSLSIGAIDSAPIGTRLKNQNANKFLSLRATTNCWAQWITSNFRSGYKTLPNGSEPLELKNV